jgi:hypothetical protein
LNKALKKVFKVSDDGIVVNLNHKHTGLIFAHMINATDGCVTGVSMRPVSPNTTINGFSKASIINEETNYKSKSCFDPIAIRLLM